MLELTLIESVACFRVSSRPPFSDQHYSFTCQFVSNPATHFYEKQREVHSVEIQKHENTIELIQQKKSTSCVFQCWVS